MAKRGDRLSKKLKEILGEKAPVAYQQQNELTGEWSAATNLDVIARNVVELAVSKKWDAIIFVAEYTEGKPTTKGQEEGGDRSTHERLTQHAVSQLNAIAKRAGGDDGRNHGGQPVPEHHAAPAPAPEPVAVSEAAAPSEATRLFLDLPKNGAGGSEGSAG